MQSLELQINLYVLVIKDFFYSLYSQYYSPFYVKQSIIILYFIIELLEKCHICLMCFIKYLTHFFQCITLIILLKENILLTSESYIFNFMRIL